MVRADKREMSHAQEYHTLAGKCVVPIAARDNAFLTAKSMVDLRPNEVIHGTSLTRTCLDD